MSEVTIYECDATGEQFGARNDVREITVKRRYNHEPFHVHEYDMHFCLQALDKADISTAVFPSEAEYIAVENGRIVGMKGSTGSYRHREHATVDQHEPFFAWLEEVLE